jgi:hypothetical protein
MLGLAPARVLAHSAIHVTFGHRASPNKRAMAKRDSEPSLPRTEVRPKLTVCLSVKENGMPVQTSHELLAFEQVDEPGISTRKPLSLKIRAAFRRASNRC